MNFPEARLNEGRSPHTFLDDTWRSGWEPMLGP